MLGCLLLVLLFAYLINCTNFIANTVATLTPCHTAYFLALLYSSAVLLSLTTHPTVRFDLSDLKIFFFVFVCASSSLSSLKVICFIITLSHHFLFSFSIPFVRFCPKWIIGICSLIQLICFCKVYKSTLYFFLLFGKSLTNIFLGLVDIQKNHFKSLNAIMAVFCAGVMYTNYVGVNVLSPVEAISVVNGDVYEYTRLRLLGAMWQQL